MTRGNHAIAYFQACSPEHVQQQEVLVLFHTPWCGYCKSVIPVFRSLYHLIWSDNAQMLDCARVGA